MVGAKSPLRSLDDIAGMARRRPGSLNYASGGLGTGSHLAGALLADRLGVELEHVPYQSTAQALTALAAGDVQLFFDAAGVKPLVEDGQIRALATTGKERWFLLPDTPTFAEAGQPDLAFESWYAFMRRLSGN